MTDPDGRLISLATIARPDMPEEVRQAALEALAETPEQRGRVLMQVVGINTFFPAKTARAITPLLLGLPNEALLAISDDLDALLDNPEPALRSAAVMLNVRSGAPLPGLAKRDPAALMRAVAGLPADQAPDNLSEQLIELVDNKQLAPATALRQAVLKSRDLDTHFDRLASYIDAVKELGYDKWSDKHVLGMAALSAMHAVPDSAWPAGYDDYRIERGVDIILGKDDEDEPLTVMDIGHEIYHEAEKGCVKCHGKQGEGEEGFPPLAGSPTLLGNPERAATIVKHGLVGELTHTLNPADGKPYSAQMENLSYMTPAQMAAVLTYARQSWGNYATPISADTVTAAPAPPDEADTWQADVLLKRFPFKRDRLLGSLPAPQWHITKWPPPKSGLVLMLLAVGVAMAAIGLPTYFMARLPVPNVHEA